MGISIDWLAFVQVFAAALIGALLVVGFYAGGLRLLVRGGRAPLVAPAAFTDAITVISEKEARRAAKAAAKAAKKEPPYHFIEVMACRGGCIAGGGQPYGANDEVRAKRAAGLYTDDANSKIRVSHKNESVLAVYSEYLKEPNSEKAHHLLHTHYVKRPLYK